MSDELLGVVQSGELTVARLREAAAAAPKAAWTEGDGLGRTPLHDLMRNPAVTAEMVRAVAEVVGKAAWGVADNYGITPLHILMMNKAVTAEMVRAVGAVAGEAAWTAVDEYGLTPLHRLMQNTAVTAEMVRAVGEVVGEAAWGVGDKYGCTPLHSLMYNSAALGTGLLGAACEVVPPARWGEPDNSGSIPLACISPAHEKLAAEGPAALVRTLQGAPAAMWTVPVGSAALLDWLGSNLTPPLGCDEVRLWARQYGKLVPRQGHPRVYDVVGLKKHGSGTSVVILAIDVATKRRVALKFMANEGEWRRERAMRQLPDGEQLDPSHVVAILDACVLDDQGLDWCRQHPELAEFGYHHLIAMPAAEMDLSDALSHYPIAGHNRQKVVEILHQVAMRLKYMSEDCGRIHGDLKPRNLVLVEIETSTGKQLVWVLIDLDASCEIGTPAGQKLTSSAFYPPEMARQELMKQAPPTHAADLTAVVAEKQAQLDAAMQRRENDVSLALELKQLQAELKHVAGTAQAEPIQASIQFEMWYFGLLLLQLSIKDAPTLWQSTQADNIMDEAQDMPVLAYFWETVKLAKVGKILASAGQAWVAAADLAQWCLEGRPERRPPSMEQVLAHRFFNESDGELRYFESMDETMDAFVQRQACALSKAIQRCDAEAVQALFDRGGVHVKMVDPDAGIAGCTALMQAAFAGDGDVMQIVLSEIADDWPLCIRQDYLDQRTSLDYTAYMVACSCGHEDIATMLVDKGCSTDLVNSSGKTGAGLLQAAHDERKRSSVSPFNHGYKLHQSCETLQAYMALVMKMLDEDLAAGIRLWHAKRSVYHFDREQMEFLEAVVKALQAKGFDVALHFTDFASCSLILHTKGIRASVVGQLGGGVSVCLRSLADFDWGREWDKFCETVGKALWGSKWYEVMSGEPWPDLQQKIESGEVKGAWPAARDHWGACSSKLETVLLVAVPSEANRNPARILPGRSDVYIIPRSDCISGVDSDSNVYYSAQNIKACLVLKPPINAAELAPQLSTLGRVLCTAQYDKKGMANLRMTAIDDSQTAIDIDEGERFSPKVTQFTMTVAQPTSPEGAVKEAHHSALQPTFSSEQLWLEDVARFKPAEMEAGILGVEQLLTQAYTMAYLYTTIERAQEICSGGIPAVRNSDTYHLLVCMLPPSSKLLGWQSNAGGGFKRRVADLLVMEEHDVQALVLLGIPTCAIEQAECTEEAVFTLSEPVNGCTFLQPTEGGGAVYSNAHVAKVWTLEATALSDARQALLDVRAGKMLTDAFAGKTEEQIRHDIQGMLASTARESGAAMEEGEPPVSAASTQPELQGHQQSEDVQGSGSKAVMAVDKELSRLATNLRSTMDYRVAEATAKKDQAVSRLRAELAEKDEAMAANEKVMVAKDEAIRKDKERLSKLTAGFVCCGKPQVE